MAETHDYICYNATQQRWIRHRAVISITKTEAAVLRGLAKGKDERQIGMEIHRDSKTVSGHIIRLRQRMKIPSVRHLAIAAEQLYGSECPPPQVNLSLLTDREMEITVLASEGLSQSQIAKKLGIQIDTVYKRINSAKGKLGVEDYRLMKAAVRSVFAK